MSGEAEKLGVKFIGVSFDKPQKNAAFKEKEGFPFALWSDDGRALAKAYGATRALGIPYAKRITVILDPQGVWRWQYTDVSPRDHPVTVIADLKTIMAQ